MSRLRPARWAGGQGKVLEGSWCPLGPLPPPTTSSDAQGEADLKSMNQNPHCVPDPGSAGRHHDFGSFGGHYREKKARSEKWGTGKMEGEVPPSSQHPWEGLRLRQELRGSHSRVGVCVPPAGSQTRWDLGIQQCAVPALWGPLSVGMRDKHKPV